MGAPGGVDEVRGLLHQVELTVADGVDRLRGGGDVERDVVAFGEDLVPLLHQLAVDVLDGAYVQSARGLDGDEHVRGRGRSPRAMAFCWLPPDMLRAMVAGP